MIRIQSVDLMGFLKGATISRLYKSCRRSFLSRAPPRTCQQCDLKGRGISIRDSLTSSSGNRYLGIAFSLSLAHSARASDLVHTVSWYELAFLKKMLEALTVLVLKEHNKEILCFLYLPIEHYRRRTKKVTTDVSHYLK